jgi:hypothetical protein
MPILFMILTGMAAAYLAKKQGKPPLLWAGLACVLTAYAPSILIVLFLVGLTLKKGKTPQSKKRQFGDDVVTLNVTPTEDLSSKKEHVNTIWYFLDDKRNTVGPMSFSVLHQKWKDGKVFKETLLWNESLKGWKTFKDLFPKASS